MRIVKSFATLALFVAGIALADDFDEELIDIDAPPRYGKGGKGSPFEKFRQRETKIATGEATEQELEASGMPSGTGMTSTGATGTTGATGATGMDDASEMDARPHPAPPHSHGPPIFMGSKILDEGQQHQLASLFGSGKQKKFQMLYSGDRDGWEASDYYDKVDNQGATFHVIKASNGKIFGGFTDINIDSTQYGQKKKDGNTWLFWNDGGKFKRLNHNKEGGSEIAVQLKKKKKMQVFGEWGVKKKTGWLNAIIIRNKPQNRDDNSCYSLSNFELPREGIDKKKEACYLFAGGNRFRVETLETYKVVDVEKPKTKAKKPQKKAENETEALPEIMTPEEQECYANRYDDLGEMSPVEHYLSIGQRQGRFYRCGDYMTWIMTGRYIDRYYWIGDEFGRTWKSFEAVRNHWYTNGSLQIQPKLSNGLNYPDEEPYVCAYDNEDCWCDGRVHYGLRMRPDNGSEIDNFQGLLSFARMTKKASMENGATICQESSMKTYQKGAKSFKQFSELPKQCWCEPLPRYEPYHCSADGGACACNGGAVIYGAKYKNETSKDLANMEDVASRPWAVTFANKTDYVQCSASSFGGVDPLPGEDKECYCDAKNTEDFTEQYNQMIMYWQGVQQTKDAEEQQAKADAEAEAAKEEDDAEHARLEAELAATKAAKAADEAAMKAKHEAEKKASDDKLAALQKVLEAEKKKAIEEAKQDEEDEKQRQEEFEKALAEAAASAKAAEAAKSAKEKAELQAAADKAKAAAIKAEVKAALAKQKKEQQKRLAEMQAQAEQDRIDREKAEAEQDRIEAEEREKAEAEEEAQRKQAEAQMKQKHAAELSQQKAAAKAALNKALADALEKQKEAYEKMMAEAERKRKQREKERQEKAAHELAKKMAAEKAAEAAEKQKEEEEAQRKLEQEEAERAQKAAEKAAFEEKLRLEKEAHDEKMKELKAKDELIRAQRLEALAKTEAEVQAAQEEAAKAQAALEEAEKQKQKTLEQKQQLQEDIKRAKARAELAAEKAAEAHEAMEESKKKAAQWKKSAEAAKKKAAKEMADAEAALEKRQKELAEAKKIAEAKNAAALKKQAAAFAEAKAAAEKAYKEQEAERKAKEAQQIAAHKAAMKARRNSFEKKFRNVWATGPTGVSYMQMTIKDDPSDVLSRLFKETMIADEWNVISSVKRSWLSHGHESAESQRHHVTMITSDDRVAEAIELVVEYAQGQGETTNDQIPFDLIVTPLATGSKDYIDWVKLQTLKRDDGTAFFNKAPPKALKAVTDKTDEPEVKESADEGEEEVQTKVEETKLPNKSKSLWGSDPEDEEEEQEE